MLFLRFVALGLLACVGSSCVASSDCGGPTSDWPRCDHDDREPSSGVTEPGDSDSESSTDDESTPPTPTAKDAGAGKKDAGKTPSADAGKPSTGTLMDAGASLPETPTAGGDASDAGVPQAPDAHVKPIEDGGTHGVDSGLDGGRPAGGSCSTESDGRDAGACFGIYCTANLDQLSSHLSARGACLADRDLTLVCDGELARVVDDCAQDNALSLGFGSTVRACARDAQSLEEASAGCIDCYVDERLCAVENCLTTCLAGRAMACTECRATRCGAAFATCSGLPRPSALSR